MSLICGSSLRLIGSQMAYRRISSLLLSMPGTVWFSHSYRDVRNMMSNLNRFRQPHRHWLDVQLPDGWHLHSKNWPYGRKNSICPNWSSDPGSSNGISRPKFTLSMRGSTRISIWDVWRKRSHSALILCRKNCANVRLASKSRCSTSRITMSWPRKAKKSFTNMSRLSCDTICHRIRTRVLRQS